MIERIVLAPRHHQRPPGSAVIRDAVCLLLFAGLGCQYSGETAIAAKAPELVAEGSISEGMHLSVLEPKRWNADRSEWSQVFHQGNSTSRYDSTRAVVAGRVDGDAVNFLVDYGSNASLITSLVWHALNRSPRRARLAFAIRSDSGRSAGHRATDSLPAAAIIDSLWIGDALRRRAEMYVVEAVSGDLMLGTYGANGLIGRDILQHYDLEFNFPARRFRMYEEADQPVRWGQMPEWRPSGIGSADCIRGHVDTTWISDTTVVFDSAGWIGETAPLPGAARARARDSIPVADLQFALMVNGHQITGMFDSGNNPTVMNWDEARLLGLTPGSRRVHRGGMAERAFPNDSGAYWVDGISMRVGGRSLAAEPIVIDDKWIGIRVDTGPGIYLGLNAFRDRVLFLSHSTGMICVSGPTPPRHTLIRCFAGGEAVERHEQN